MQRSPEFRAVLSPCTGVCTLRDDGLCEGCLRSADEIAAWPRMDDDARLHWLECVLPAREVARG
jgi:predicted Fe-S protein YdhL (DUF1289 family)